LPIDPQRIGRNSPVPATGTSIGVQMALGVSAVDYPHPGEAELARQPVRSGLWHLTLRVSADIQLTYLVSGRRCKSATTP